MISPLLRVPDVRLLLAGETVTALGTAVSSIAMPLVALEVLHAGVFLLAAATIYQLVTGGRLSSTGPQLGLLAPGM